MGIAPYKSFTFDGESSLNYGVYLTGEGVFNAPVRAVEMIEIPGRNGNFALDQGRFENITVTYQAGMYDVNESNFADKVSAVRNWLCSKVGYCRLEDEYNPNEYRMAVYSSGLEVSHDMLIAGEFEITFECKPQRWLTSGETAVSVTSGDTLTNPTLFASSPRLIAKGYGNISFAGNRITLDNTPVGEVLVSSGGETTYNFEMSYPPANNNDTISIDTCTVNFDFGLHSGITAWDSTLPVSIATPTWTTGNGTFNNKKNVNNQTITVTLDPTTAPYGSINTLWETTANVQFKGKNSNGVSKSEIVTVSILVRILGTGNMRLATATATHYSGDTVVDLKNANLVIRNIYINSTSSGLGSPTIIDLDIGEAYFNSGPEKVPANSAVIIPATLPTLPPGSTTVTFDNTITELKILPRWWKV